MIKPTSVEGGSGRSTCASRSTPVLPGCRVMFWTVLAVSAGKTNSATCLDYNDSGSFRPTEGTEETDQAQRRETEERRTNGRLGGLHAHAEIGRAARLTWSSSVFDRQPLVVKALAGGAEGGERRVRVMAISDHRALWPMPARPSAGPGDRPTPRGHKPLHSCASRLVSAGCRSIARRAARGGIGGSARRVSAPEAPDLRPPAYSVSPRL